MSAPALPAADARRAATRSPAPKPRKIRVAHPKAIAVFIVPFAILFTLFYLIPIGYAIYSRCSWWSVTARSARPPRCSAA